jgi:TPR repeat protein
MGVVWLAHDEELSVDIALKFLPDLVALDPEALEDLKSETRRSRELAHKNIVKVYHFESKAGRAAIAMEYVDGATLADERNKRKPRCLDPSEILPWLEQIADALEYAHIEAKMVHRDLKPKNIMLTKSGRIKVTDFGIASAIVDRVSQASMRHPRSGTPPYMSPQQMDGKLSTPSDDIYSLGATIYDLVTGKPPFYRGNPGALAHQIQNIIPPSMTGRRHELGVAAEQIPEQWNRTVAACLEKDSANRPQSAREVVALLQAPPPEIKATTRDTRDDGPRIAAPPVPRNRLLILAGTVAATILILAIVFARREARQTSASNPVPPAPQEQPAASPAESANATDKNSELASAESDYAEADNYRFGMGRVLVDNAKAVALMARAASRHLPEASARLAIWLYYGLPGVAKDRGMAEASAREALDHGLITRAQQNANAQAALGVLYRDGIGITKDPGKSVELLRRASDKGLAGAQYGLGNSYETGQGVAKDFTKAAALYQKAADQNHAAAQNDLGVLYQFGTGVTQDLSRAAELYKKSADQGYAEGETSLGVLYTKGLGVPKDFTKAANLYQKAADRGSRRAQNNLGVLYQYGTGVTKNLSKAAALYQEAAAQGFAEAQNNLGILYKNGLGVTQDINKAAELYRKAADQGLPEAQNNLGILYESGTAVTKNPFKAAELYQKAADQGLREAQNNLGALYEIGTGLTKDVAKAAELYQKAADQGLPQAQNNLGELYEKGMGVMKDPAKALALYQKAAAQDFEPARKNLERLQALRDVKK